MAKGRKKTRSKWPLAAAAIVLLIALGVCLFASLVRIEQVTFVGTSVYSEQTLEELIFEEPKEKSLLYAWLNDRFGSHKEIPFLERYELEFTDLHSVEITLYEKKIVACLEYMGSYMYFDKDGLIVESSSEKKTEVPVISGLSFDRIVLHSVLPIEDEALFESILNLTQLLQKHQLPVDKIYFDGQKNVVFYLDRIRVRLGSCDYLDGKVNELVQMLPKLQGLSGTLFLDTYSEVLPPSSYVFQQDEGEN